MAEYEKELRRYFDRNHNQSIIIGRFTDEKLKSQYWLNVHTSESNIYTGNLVDTIFDPETLDEIRTRLHKNQSLTISSEQIIFETKHLDGDSTIITRNCTDLSQYPLIITGLVNLPILPVVRINKAI